MPKRFLPFVLLLTAGLLLVERQRVEVPGRAELLAAERACGVPGCEQLDAVVVVAQPAERELLRPAVGGTGEHGSLCGATRRSQDVRRDAASESQVTVNWVIG